MGEGASRASARALAHAMFGPAKRSALAVVVESGFDETAGNAAASEKEDRIRSSAVTFRPPVPQPAETTEGAGGGRGSQNSDYVNTLPRPGWLVPGIAVELLAERLAASFVARAGELGGLLPLEQQATLRRAGDTMRAALALAYPEESERIERLASLVGGLFKDYGGVRSGDKR